MPAFFSALNPMSSNSGITFHVTKHPYSEEILQQNMPDLTLDLIIPFLLSRNLSIWDGIYETYKVFAGDHFDKNSRGFGQKGVLDFTLLPLLSRKLIADTYLEERKDSHFLNFLALAVSLPIMFITNGVALVFTIAMIPIVIGVTLLRFLFPGSPPRPPGASGAAEVAMVLPKQAAYAALHVALHRLELAGIRNSNNIRRLLAEPQNLVLVYAIESFTHIVEENGNFEENQEIFDFLLEHRVFWTDVRIIENLDEFYEDDGSFMDLDELKRAVERPVEEIVQYLMESTDDKSATLMNDFITPATVALKLPLVVRQALRKHLSENPNDVQGFNRDGFNFLWYKLKRNVIEDMDSNFSTIYPRKNGEINPDLIAMYMAGVNAGDYNEMTKDLQIMEQESRPNSTRQPVGERVMI